MKTALYIYQNEYSWDVRSEKFFEVLNLMGLNVFLLDKSKRKKELRTGVIVEGIDRIMDIPIPQNPFWTRFIKKKIDDHKPELIVVRDLPLALNAIEANKNMRIPLILDLAEFYPGMLKVLPKYNENIIIRYLTSIKYFNKLEKKAIRKATVTLVVCEENKSRIEKTYKYAEHMRIEVVENIPNTRFFGSPIIRPLKEDTAPISLVYLGNLDDDSIRGFDDIVYGLKCFEEKDYTKLMLVVIGEGKAKDSFNEKLRLFLKRTQVSFKGFLKYEDLYKEIPNWDIGVIPHRKNDLTENTFPNKYYEYLFCGISVLASNCTPLIREIKKDALFGAYYESGNPESFSEALRSMIATRNYGFSEQRRTRAISTYSYVDKVVLPLERVIIKLCGKG